MTEEEAYAALQAKALDTHMQLTAEGEDAVTDAPERPLQADVQAVRRTLLDDDRDQEWHVTVAATDPLRWVTFCRSLGVQPLFLELRDTRLQLMSTLHFDPRAPMLANDLGPSFVDLCAKEGFVVVRIKHGVRELQAGETAFYHEAHAKLDGPWRPDRRGSSRDLLRLSPGRWYLTKREVTPIDGAAFAALARTFCKGSTLAGVETEAVLEDTNIALDAGWL